MKRIYSCLNSILSRTLRSKGGLFGTILCVACLSAIVYLQTKHLHLPYYSSYSSHLHDIDETPEMSTGSSGVQLGATSYRSFFQDNCFSCHNREESSGGLRLDNLSLTIDTPASAERWQDVLNAINSGEMPPDSASQPSRELKTEILAELASRLVVARKSLADSGGQIVMRRLNRREYGNTIRALLGVQIDVSELPADGTPGTFDTVGSSLYMSGDQIDMYYALGRKALKAATRKLQQPATPIRTHRVEAEETISKAVRTRLDQRKDYRRRYREWVQAVDSAASLPANRELASKLRSKNPKQPWKFYLEWFELENAPSPTAFKFPDAVEADALGREEWENWSPAHIAYVAMPNIDSGAYLGIADIPSHLLISKPKDWPTGDYVIRVRLGAVDTAPAHRRFVELGARDASDVVLSSHQVIGTVHSPRILQLPVDEFHSSNPVFFLREKGPADTSEKPGRVFGEAFTRNGVGPDLVIWVDWIEIEGPIPSNEPAPVALAELGRLLADSADENDADVRGLVDNFATHAFRGRQPTPEYIDQVVDVFHSLRASGSSFEDSILEAFSVILASPGFVYLAEASDPDGRRPLSDLELAVRLSYFLWSGPPDSELLQLAQSKKLRDRDVLKAQIDRLLDDPRSIEFVSGFSSQWLGLQRLDFFQFDSHLYPKFDHSAKAAARSEVFQTIAFLLEHNLPLSKLLKADFIIANGLLANYYEIPHVDGDEYRKVSLQPHSPRGGLLGMAAILAMGSNGHATSPVERGAWVLRKLLHDPPPPPPPNVPQLNRIDASILTVRKRLALHRTEAQCAACHRKIDPIGLGLENFDAVGQWRTAEREAKGGDSGGSSPINSAGKFHNGPSFGGFLELREIIASREEEFAIGLVESLLEYSLGRPHGFSDAELVTSIVEAAKSRQYAMREFIYALVLSETFQSK